MLWLFFPEIIQSFIGRLGTLLDYVSSSVGGVLLTVFTSSFLAPIVPLFTGLQLILNWAGVWLLDGFRQGVQDAFFSSANLYVLYSALSDLLFGTGSEDNRCLKTQTLRIGSDISIADYKKILSQNDEAVEDFIRNEVDYAKAKANEYSLIAWLKDNVTRQVPMMKDLELTTAEAKRFLNIYFTVLSQREQKLRLFKKLFESGVPASLVTLTPEEQKLANDITNFQFYLKSENLSLSDAAPDVTMQKSREDLNRLFRIANRLVETSVTIEQTQPQQSIFSVFFFS